MYDYFTFYIIEILLFYNLLLVYLKIMFYSLNNNKNRWLNGNDQLEINNPKLTGYQFISNSILKLKK